MTTESTMMSDIYRDGATFDAMPLGTRDRLAAAEKLAHAVEAYAPEFYNVGPWTPKQIAVADELRFALAHYRELCPVTAQDAQETEAQR